MYYYTSIEVNLMNICTFRSQIIKLHTTLLSMNSILDTVSIHSAHDIINKLCPPESA